jgi:hypothetical protein
MRKLTLVPALAVRSVAGVSRPAQAKGPATGVKRWPVPRAVVLRAVLAVIVSAALATTALAAPANAKVPGPRVKFSSPRFDPSVGDGVLYVMNPDGTGLHQVLRGWHRVPKLVTGRITDRHLRLAGRCSISHHQSRHRHVPRGFCIRPHTQPSLPGVVARR